MTKIPYAIIFIAFLYIDLFTAVFIAKYSKPQNE